MLTTYEIKERVFRFIGTEPTRGYRAAERVYHAAIVAEIRGYGPFGNNHKAESLYLLHGDIIKYTYKLLPPLGD